MRIFAATVLIYGLATGTVAAADLAARELEARGREAVTWAKACLMAPAEPTPLTQWQYCTLALESQLLQPGAQRDLLIIRARSNIDQGEFDAAAADAEAALDIDATSGEAKALSAEIMAAREKASKLDLEQAILGCVKWKDAEKRLQACDTLLKASTANQEVQATAFELRAGANLSLGKLDEALGDIDAAAKLNNGHWQTRMHRAIILLQKEDYELALKSFETLSYDQIGADHRLDYATALYASGQAERAAEVFAQARKGGLPDFYSALVKSELAEGDVAAFRKVDLAETNGPFAEALLAFRQLKLSPEKLLESAMALDRFSQGPALCMAHFNIGHEAAMIGDRVLADEAFRLAGGYCDPQQFEFHAAKLWSERIKPEPAPTEDSGTN